MEVKLGVRRTRRSSPNPDISLYIDNDTNFKHNIAHLKGSPAVKISTDIKQDGAEIAVVSGEREVVTSVRRVREDADHVRIHEESVPAMKEVTGGGGSHEKTGAMADKGVLQEGEKIRMTVQERKAGIEDVKVTVEAAAGRIIVKACPEEEPAAQCSTERRMVAVPPPEVAPPIKQEKSNVCEQSQGSGATESTIKGAPAEKHNSHGEPRQVETPQEEAAQTQLNLNINIGNAAPAETINNRKLLRSPSFLAGSAALLSVIALAIHFIRPRRR